MIVSTFNCNRITALQNRTLELGTSLINELITPKIKKNAGQNAAFSHQQKNVFTTKSSSKTGSSPEFHIQKYINWIDEKEVSRA